MKTPNNDWVGTGRSVVIKTEKHSDGHYIAYSPQVKGITGEAGDSRGAIEKFKQAQNKNAANGGHWSGEK